MRPERINLAQPVPNEDRLPHDRAVWRRFEGLSGRQPNGTQQQPVAVDYGEGQIVEGLAHEIRWAGVKRWRFGWAPR